MTLEDKKIKAEQKKLERLEKKKAKLEKFEQKKIIEANKVTKENKPKVVQLNKPNIIVYTENTPHGEKKNTLVELPKSYSPKYTEAAWYDWWQKEGFFEPEYGKCESELDNLKNDDKFVVIMPPPNVTGTLHLGHALMCSIQDVLVRWARMKGKVVLWNPGCDHAGVATQVVVERKLKNELNLSRFDLGRENFLDHVWQWKNEKGDIIYNQMKRMGISCDWDRQCFTMDDNINKAVVQAFIQLHDENLIYRANRLVNWSCSLRSAISDIEVEKKELPGKTFISVPEYDYPLEFGTITYFYYKLTDSDSKILIATTRLETMLGDVAILINPNDQRYTHLHNKYVEHPFCNRVLPILLDDSIDIDFGTGIMKLTPAHDLNDYELGVKHKLPFINIFTTDGCITQLDDIKPEFRAYLYNVKRFDARKIVADNLIYMDLFSHVESHAMVLPICSRSKDIVEPLLKPQWYIDCKMMAKDAVEVVRNNELQIIPESFEKTWYQWMENHRDWCISRQLWWGHRIPAYKCTFLSNEHLPDYIIALKDSDKWVSAENIGIARVKAIKKFNLSPAVSVHLKQDNDVLDTWFSSGLFPFGVFGWPDKTNDLKRFYPTTLLETGHDILFFWVARMVMLARKLTGELPFTQILLHSIIRDAHGRKMSKSLGNIIDPIDVIEGISLTNLHDKLKTYNLAPQEMNIAMKCQKHDFPNGIPECGTDALRFSLCAYTSQGRDINLDILRIQGYRFFCNKIWNAVKFMLMHFLPNEKTISDNKFILDKLCDLSNIDKWILSRLDLAIETIDKSLSEYQLQKATTAAYNFWLYELCDVYIEAIKSIIGTSPVAKYVLLYCIHDGLKLLAPFMPFITEELYQRLPISSSSVCDHPVSITIARFPKSSNMRNIQLEKDFDFVLSVIRAIRSTKENYVPGKTKTDCFIVCDNSETKLILHDFKNEIIALANLKSLDIFTSQEHLNVIGVLCAETIVDTKCKINIVINGLVEPKKELEKLRNHHKKVHSLLLKTEKSIKNFDQTVPVDIQKSTEQKLNDLTVQIKDIEIAIAKFELLTVE